MNNERKIIDSVETLESALASLKDAEKKFSTYTQEQVDKIFLAAASAANKARIPLAKMAVEETGMGVVEDKVIKNNYAAEYIYNAYKNTKTCGIIEEDKAYGIKKIAEPVGVIAAVIPHDEPNLHRHIQVPACPQDQKRYYHQPPSPRQEINRGGRKGSSRRGSQGRRSRGHH